jgi:hypothetical protein
LPTEGGALVDTDAELELVLDPQHTSLDDDRFAGQIRDLTSALTADVGGVSSRTVPAPGTKGGLPELILALGTSGAIGAALAVFKRWLDRDKLRKIRIKIRTKGTSREVEITADAGNVAELERLLIAARTK